MNLTQEQKQEFYERGILKLPGIVPQELVLRARRAINAYLGQNGIDPSELPRYRAQSYCPGLGSDPVITDLYNASPLKTVAESLIGEGKVKPVGGGQIALRFPSTDETPRAPGPHIDGMYTPTNGVERGDHRELYRPDRRLSHGPAGAVRGQFYRLARLAPQVRSLFQEQGPQALLKGLPPVDIGQPEQFTEWPGCRPVSLSAGTRDRGQRIAQCPLRHLLPPAACRSRPVPLVA
jgi:hypothetical protein